MRFLTIASLGNSRTAAAAPMITNTSNRTHHRFIDIPCSRNDSAFQNKVWSAFSRMVLCKLVATPNSYEKNIVYSCPDGWCFHRTVAACRSMEDHDAAD